MDNYIRKLEIESLFNEKNKVKINFEEKINCIYGVNGTGKTTVINLLVSSLTGDVGKLFSIPFKKISIFTAVTNKLRPNIFLEVTKITEEGKIKYFFPKIPETFEFAKGRGGFEKDSQAHKDLTKLIQGHLWITYVPLSRMQESEIYDADRPDEYFLTQALRSRRISPEEVENLIDPSKRMLSNLEGLFKKRYAETQDEINKGHDSLKNSILAKMLLNKRYASVLTTKALNITRSLPTLDYSEYSKKLKAANINIEQSALQEHFEVMQANVNELNQLREGYIAAKNAENENLLKDYQEKYSVEVRKYRAIFPIYDQFLNILKDVESIQNEKEKLLNPFKQTQELVNDFLRNKTFSFAPNEGFVIKCNEKEIKIGDLSSGEKHMIALLGRVALSPSEGAVFVADEPELSLHLEWQRKMIPSILQLSPKIQIIVATHSPAIIPSNANQIDLQDCKI